MSKPFGAALVVLAVALLRAAPDDREELWAAARQGETDRVKAVLARGVDVNARSQYGATALSFAADKGHLAVVKVLLQHKADVNAKDTFYNATPLTWALMRKHWPIVKALVEAGANGAEGALLPAASGGQADVVRAVLAKAKPKPEALASALAAVPADRPEVAEQLRKAGAKPPANGPNKTDGLPDAEALKAYAGSCEGPEGAEFAIVLKDGKLRIQSGGRDVLTLNPVDRTTFKAAEYAEASVAFQRDGDKVTGFAMKVPGTTMTFTRAQPRQGPADAPKADPDKPIRVVAPRNWPSFRGPGATGIADGQQPPTSWDVKSGRNVRWKAPIPGLGHSCPVVWGDRVFLTTAVSSDKASPLRVGQYGDVDSLDEKAVHSWRVYCLDKRTGKVLWERTAHEGVPRVKRHPKGSHANPTPATDGKHLVVSFGSEGLFGYDLDGKPLWKRDLGTLDAGWFYDPAYQWGFGSSPVLYRDRAIVQCDVGKGSFLAAYGLTDGKPVWNTPREEIPSWGTPTVCEWDGGAELVANASKFVRGYDPETGKELWRLGRNAEITVPTPFAAAGLVFVTSGYRPIQPIYAIRLGARGDITLKDDAESSEHVAWGKKRGGPYMPTPIAYEGHLYVCANGGLLTCYEAKMGKQVYQQRLGGRGGYTASPVAADGRLYFASEEGEVRVVRAGPTFELLATNRMDDLCMATPAIADGMLFVRTQHALVALGRPAGK
jgi:outer membrane protein assembly factor BamB